jgi:transposase-like protein
MRAQWSEHEARAVIAAWRRSGLSVEKFAEQRGLVPQRIYWWRKKLEQPTKALVKAESALALLPVQVSKPAAPSRARGEPVMVMLRSGHVIKVGRGFDEEAFARAMAILEGA